MDLKTVNIISKRFTPTWKGNDKLAPTDQFIISFKRIPSTSEMPRFINVNTGVIDYHSFLLECIGNIENLTVNGERIKNGRDLATAKHPDFFDLFTELFNHAFPGDEEEFSEGE